MRITGKAFPGFILFAAVFALSGNGVALASTAVEASQANAPPVQADSGSHACLAPLIMASGGLCCPGAQSSKEPCVSSSPTLISAKQKKLKPLVVNGVQIPLPVTLQMVKKALGRTWSSAAADRNVMVCEFREIPGTRVPFLYCNMNYVHFKGVEEKYTNINSSDTKVHCYFNCFLTRNNIIVSLTRYVDNDMYTAKVLASLLGKTPAATASYSLRVPETVPMWLSHRHLVIDSPAYVTFVIGNGRLADVQLSGRSGKAKIVKHEAHYKQPKQRANVGSALGSLCNKPSVTC